MNPDAGLAPAPDNTTAAPVPGADSTDITPAAAGVAAGFDIDGMTDEQFRAFLDGVVETGEIPTPPPAPEPEPEPAASTEPEPEPDAEPEETEPAKLRQRLEFATPEDAEAARLYRLAKKNGKPITLAEADRRARIALGLADPEPAPAAPAPSEPAPKVADLAKLDERIATLREEMDRALEDFETDRAKEIRDELLALADERLAAKEEAMVRQAEQQRAFGEQWDKAEAEIVAAYPDLGNHASEASKRAVEIFEAWQALGDPRALRPDAPKIVGNLVAQELGLVPGQRKNAPTPAAKKSSPAPTPGRPQPASGSLGTANPGTSIAAMIDSMTDEQFREYLDKIRR